MIEWIKELRSTEKGRVLFKFILYMVFFVAVMLLIVITNAVNPPRKQSGNSSESTTPESSFEEVKEELTYFEKQEKLHTGHYDFTYQIKGEKIAEYNGEYYNGNVVGYRETEDDLIKYSIENGIVYLNELTGKTEYNDLYLDFCQEFFDLKKLFQKLNSTSSKIEKNGDEKWYKYENIDGYSFVICTSKEGIETIEIYDDSIKYSFSFDYR